LLQGFDIRITSEQIQQTITAEFSPSYHFPFQLTPS
jgi:hypothetical protein